jgi:DHA1 family bicyclomycin/chloramphenicol resistance-like MFS transporter
VVATVGWRLLPETLPPERRTAPHLGAVLRSLGGVLGLRRFLAYVAVTAGVGGMLFGYIGASAFVLENVFGRSPQEFSLVFAGNSVGLFAMTWLTRHLVVRVGPARLLLAGQLLAIAGCGVLAIGVGTRTLAVVVAGLFLAVSSLGLVMPTATALGMTEAPGRAGAASGVMGICQFTVGAAASPLAGLGGSAWSLVVVMAVCSVSGLVARLVLLASQPFPSTVRSPA